MAEGIEDSTVSRAVNNADNDDDDDNDDDNDNEVLQHHPSLAKRRRMCLSVANRRYLVVPSSEEDLNNMENAYTLFHHECIGNNARSIGQKEEEVDDDDGGDYEESDVWMQACLQEITSKRYRRPLPSTQVLSSLVAISRTNRDPFNPHQTPLMEKFYRSIGIENSAMSTVVASHDAIERNHIDNDRTALDDIDNPIFSTLTIGQHRRYLQLTDLHQTERRTEAQRRELKALKQHILQEQTAYNGALDRFHTTHKARYRIGFDSPSNDSTSSAAVAGAFCRWACSYAQLINKEWVNLIRAADDSRLPKLYGKPRQILSLHLQSSTSTHLDVQDLMCKIVHEETPQLTSASPPNRRMAGTLPNVGTGLHPPHPDAVPPITLLRNDTTALKIAAQHSANIITTSETLEALLHCPADLSSQWILNAKKVSLTKGGSANESVSSAMLLDVPIAQAYATPRSCLERGLQEGLYQAWSRKVGTDRSYDEKKTAPIAVQSYIYSLWTLPNLPNTVRKRRVNVLIRTPIRSVDPTTKRPLCLRAHVEYFWSKRDKTNEDGGGALSQCREIPNSYESALWILDQVLLGNQVSSQHYRIDPDSCTIVERDTVSIAHAFAIFETSRRTEKGASNPLDHWQTLIQLLHALQTIDIPESLLCLPGRIAVAGGATNHSPSDNRGDDTQSTTLRLDPFSVSVHAPTTLTSANTLIDLELTMERAGAVVLNDGALQACRREWEWNRQDQVPNTFPVDVRRDTKSTET